MGSDILDGHLVDEYMIWLTGLVMSGCERDNYKSLVSALMDKIFVPFVGHDADRGLDALNLRKRFANFYGCDTYFWFGILSPEPTMLEMLIALAIRWDQDFMFDPEIGDRTRVWFWEMLTNLGLNEESDLDYDYDKVEKILEICVKRHFCKNGTGGIFPIKNDTIDMRITDLWYQLNYYVMENYWNV